MKKILSILTLIPFTLASFAQGLQVTPPSSNVSKSVSIAHAAYPTNYLLSEPQILSTDLSSNGEKVLILQSSSGLKALSMYDLQSGKSSTLSTSNVSVASKAFIISESIAALQVHLEEPSFEIIETQSGKVLETFTATDFIGTSGNAAYFSNNNSSSASILKFDLSTKKISTVGTVAGEVFGWYFTEAKGVVGVAVHSNMVSRIHTVENFKVGKSLFEFSSGYYFEPKGCNLTGEVFYAITNFQSLTSYACAISKTGIKPLNNKTAESCTDIYIQGNDMALSSNSINAAEYQESSLPTIQKILAFAKDSFKGSSIKILDFSEKNNTILFSLESETIKPHFFIWKNNQAKPLVSDKFETKNLSFIASEVVQIQTGEATPQTGRMYLPMRESKSNYPLVIYFPKNIFLPYSNQFNPVVQNLCQNGYAVFVWNSRFSFRPKIGFTYSDLVASFPEDISLLLTYLKKEYSLMTDKSFILGEGQGGYLALNASALSNEPFTGVIMTDLQFPGKNFNQDLLAARMFGEDAQSKWNTLDKTTLSEKSNYLSYSSKKSNTELRFESKIKQSKIKWTDRESKNANSEISVQQLDGIYNWLQHLSQIETKVFEDKPKVEVKKK